jgi:hypothetical protein
MAPDASDGHPEGAGAPAVLRFQATTIGPKVGDTFQGADGRCYVCLDGGLSAHEQGSNDIVRG